MSLASFGLGANEEGNMTFLEGIVTTISGADSNVVIEDNQVAVKLIENRETVASENDNSIIVGDSSKVTID